MIIQRSIIDEIFGGPKPQQILCSSAYSTPRSYTQYFRSMDGYDPLLGYYDHGTSADYYDYRGTSSMMYMEKCKSVCIVFVFDSS